MNDILMEFTGPAGASTLTRRWVHSDRVDEPLAYENYLATGPPASGTVLDVYTDRMGSVVMVVDPATNIIAAQYDYDAFGNRVQVVGTEQQPYGFTGREFDAESGLNYFRARHLDTGLGQFVQRDPIGFAAGDMNLYAYVWNNPLRWHDPSGLAVTTGFAMGLTRDEVIRAGLLTTAFTAIAVLAHQTGELIKASIERVGPGMGHNGGPKMDGPDPKVVAILAAALGVAAESVEYEVEFGYNLNAPLGTGAVNLTSQVKIEGDTVTLDGFMIFSPGNQTNIASRRDLQGMAANLSRTSNKKTVVINAYRIGGKNAGENVRYTFQFK